VSTTLQLLGLSALWAVALGALTWYVMQVLRQVTYVTLADGERLERHLPPILRLLLPLTPNLVPLFRRPSFDESRRTLSGQIVSSGFAGLLSPDDVLALRLLVPSTFGVLLSGILWALVAATPGRVGEGLQRNLVIWLLLPLLWGYTYPSFWLRATIRMRHRFIQRALPFVLDLLTLSVEAGLDFMTALQRIVGRRGQGPLGEEITIVLREIQLGKSRREALQGMSDRVNQPDLRRFINAMVQADELGVGIASVLRIQSDQLRALRFERAEKLANEAPVKLLFPLVAFIFPAVFLVLLGPIVLQILRQI